MARPSNLFFPTDEGALITGDGGHMSTASRLPDIPAASRARLASANWHEWRRGQETGILAVDMGSASDSLRTSGGEKMVLYRAREGIG